MSVHWVASTLKLHGMAACCLNVCALVTLEPGARPTRTLHIRVLHKGLSELSALGEEQTVGLVQRSRM